MSLETALALIESVKDSKVLFVGDTIIDEYHYVKPLGKALKEHLIPVEYQSKEVFRGGIEAAANHARTFCKTVDVASFGKIIRKVRLIDPVYFRKLFEVHYHEGLQTDRVISTDYDIIVVVDYGHGAITNSLMDQIYQSGRFLALNVQTNSSNFGFNLLTKHPGADYIVTDDPEARLAAANRDGPLEDVVRKLAYGRCPMMVVTLGSRGALGYENGLFFHSKGMSEHSLDTMGAGDAFFAVTAPMAKEGNMEDLLFIGNAAGAMKTQVVGHRSSITKEALCEFIKKHQ